MPCLPDPPRRQPTRHPARHPARRPGQQRRLAAVLTGALLLGQAGCAWLPAAPPPPAPPPGPVLPLPPPTPRMAAHEPAPLPPSPPPAATTPALDTAARRLLAWQDRLRDLAAADIGREAQRLELATRQPDAAEAAAATLELALLLAQPRPQADLPRAMALADNLARNDSMPALQALARLLQARLAEQRRQDELLERQAQQLRDQQRRLDQLSSQLEALKAIERSLTIRPPAQGPAPSPGRNPP